MADIAVRTIAVRTIAVRTIAVRTYRSPKVPRSETI
ncbi:putative uncharacterized protein [Corynebacterium casei UCMA 3821]|uniref:Uncharacterized protein n=1 Tax=Corynebacterium casei UCMA 3821 TaxID=1110505 RepID=G7HYS8_9CORY|nr:putative uncharacterized protein [Corynebacterium casei UCMA 3821]